MLKLYSPKKTERIISQYGEWIETVSERYSIPSPCVKAVLRKEIADIDLLDPVADMLVWLNWLRFRLSRRLFPKKTRFCSGKVPAGRYDSSAGYAQIFAYVAINAAGYAIEKGLEDAEGLGLQNGRQLDRENADDLCGMWHRLKKDMKFNIRMGTLNLISAACEMNGHTDFSRYTPEEYQLAFTRYNANVRSVTNYGREVYGFYLDYRKNGNRCAATV